jgi:hypothetical protein
MMFTIMKPNVKVGCVESLTVATNKYRGQESMCLYIPSSICLHCTLHNQLSKGTTFAIQLFCNSHEMAHVTKKAKDSVPCNLLS